MDINGTCNPDFAGVQDAFASNFQQGLELGASVCVTVDGQPVVDLWAGHADQAGTPWQQDTIVNVFSLTKTMSSLCLLMLADRGQLDFAAPVATYWPEFAAGGKQDIPVSQIMAHTSGLAGWARTMTVEDLYDWDTCVELLAAQEPWWEPGTQSGYHSVTQGYLQGEILRRITGQDIDQFFRSEISGPLGADFHLSLGSEHDQRVASMIIPPPVGASKFGGSHSVAHRTEMNPVIDGSEQETRAWRNAIIPAAGGWGNPPSTGRIHSAMACGGTVDGVTLLSPAGVEVVLQEQISGPDLVLGMDATFGMGFGLGGPMMPLPPRAFFWGGWGGSLAMVDLDRRATITYVMNRMAGTTTGDQRGGSVVMAAFTALLAG